MGVQVAREDVRWADVPESRPSRLERQNVSFDIQVESIARGLA